MSFIFCLLSFIFVSCNSDFNKTAQILKSAENVVEQYPDSALLLLDSIRNPYELRSKELNRFCLLQIQAKDKSYKDITSDTVIFDVKDYYFHKKDFQNAALAAFYCGRVWHEQKNIEKAIEAYFEAEKLAGKTNNYNLKGLIQGNLGILYYEHSSYDKAITPIKEAIKMYDKANNFKNKISAMSLIGDCFLLSDKTDSAFYYYDESLKFADSCNIPELQSSIRQNMGVAYREIENYKDAKKFFTEAIALTSDMVKQARILLNMAQLYSFEYRMDSAKYYLDKAMELQISNPWLIRSSCLLRSNIEEDNKNYHEALKSYKEYYNYTMEVYDNESNNKLMELQEKYDHEKIKNSNNQLTIKHQRIQILLILTLIVAGLVTSIFYRRFIRNKKISLELEQKIIGLKKMADNFSKENHTFRNIALDQFNIIRKAASITAELTDNEIKSGQKLLNKFNKIIYGQDTLNWEKLYNTMNNTQNGLYDKIKEKYPQLNETEFRILCLTCEKLPTSTLFLSFQKLNH